MKHFLILIGIFLILFIVLSFVDYKVNENFYSYIDPESLINNPDICYVLWTGGYDSSFRVLQALIDENKIVQPVYISDFIDNKPGKNTHRKNKSQEYKAMNTITQLFKEKYPDKKDNLLDIIDIKKIHLDTTTNYHMKKLKKNKSVRRTTCQYGAISQLSKDINKTRHGSNIIYLELGVVKEEHNVNKSKNVGIYNTIKNNIDPKNYKISNQLNHDSVNLFKYLRFPLIDLTKKDMLNIATNNGYNHILKHSWSCWYPKSNGSPCKRCIMCRERILK
jgi:hypothetical protein